MTASDVARAEVGHGAEQRTRIEAGREEDGDRHIGDEMMANRIAHGVGHVGTRLRQIAFAPPARRASDRATL